MRVRRLSIVTLIALVFGIHGPAGAQVTALDAAAQALRNNPVFVDGAVRVENIPLDVDRLRARARRSDTPIFVAVLPAAAAEETGGEPGRVPATLAQKTGLRGTYAVLVGRSFRAASNVLPTGRAETLATTAFQRNTEVQAVLEDFIDRANQEVASGVSGGSQSGSGTESTEDGGGGAGGGGAVLLLLAVGGGGLYMWSRGRRKKRQAADAKQLAADRQMLQADLSVLGDDVLALEPEVTMHPDARDDYDAGVTRFKSAQAALEYADDQVDLVRVGRVIDEGRYAMARARAVAQGRPPPPPPPELTRPGRHDEPAMELDEAGAPRYSGYGGPMPFYGGGGWFGGGTGLLTGLMLGQMLGGGFGGWGGGYYGGGAQGDGGGGGSDGGDGGGGGGGDWGGGDFGGGDFGGGDFGGGGDF